MLRVILAFLAAVLPLPASETKGPRRLDVSLAPPTVRFLLVVDSR